MVEARKALTEPTLLLHLRAHAGNRLGKRKKITRRGIDNLS